MLDRPGAPAADPLAEVLRLLRVERAISATLEAGGAWSLRFPAHEQLKFSAVVRGDCWLAVDGHAEPVRLRAGDAYLLAAGAPYRLASDLALRAADAGPEFARAAGATTRPGAASAAATTVRYGGADTVLVGGGFALDARDAALLLDALPPLVVLRGDDPAAPRAAAAVRAAVELLAAEHAAPAPALGGALLAERLADVLFVQALRVVAAGGAPAPCGWLRGLGDPQVGAALRAMHADLARRWTVAQLAAAVGLSRSSFAERFRRLVGSPPLDYLLRWRMLAAARALEDPARTVSSVAHAYGYGSDSAFSNAFKRVMGAAPAHYRAAARAAAG